MSWVLVSCIIIGIILFTPIADSISGVYYTKIKIKSFFDNIFNSLSQINCPQINITLKEEDSKIILSSDNFDGWIVKSTESVTCRKGSEEGENLNYYYCGGFQTIFGISVGNVYIEKKGISSEGYVGKTKKYVIWNIYDQNKNFVETKCLGDPDKIKEKETKDFIQSLKYFS